ncbi:MAG: LysR family transcriptional regulator, partial [Pseudomonadota bacterium]
MRPNHHQFVAFAYVVREGSFSAAASELGVTQSTITQHVAKLEQNVGAQLLWRRRDGVEVTATGQALYDLADRLVAVDMAISERLEGFASMKDGRIKVIANAPQPALGIIARFNKAFPQIHIDFGLHDWTTATSMIRDRLADVGLITDPPLADEWERHLLQSTRYVAYCRSDDPLAGEKELSLHQIADRTVILPEKGSLTQRIVRERLQAHGLTLRKSVSMTT